jgi:hypothetical protein
VWHGAVAWTLVLCVCLCTRALGFSHGHWGFLMGIWHVGGGVSGGGKEPAVYLTSNVSSIIPLTHVLLLSPPLGPGMCLLFNLLKYIL